MDADVIIRFSDGAIALTGWGWILVGWIAGAIAASGGRS